MNDSRNAANAKKAAAATPLPCLLLLGALTNEGRWHHLNDGDASRSSLTWRQMRDGGTRKGLSSGRPTVEGTADAAATHISACIVAVSVALKTCVRFSPPPLLC